MAEHLKTGEEGERIATDFLSEKGYKILERNWRFKRAEVDIIAKDEATDVVVFVEVKTRSSDAFGTPDAFVSLKKERLIADAAQAYCQRIGHDWEIRFDIISVLLQGGTHHLAHFEDAFFPGWE